MEAWGWLAGYVVLFALLHVGLYYYHLRRQDGDESARPSFSGSDYAGARTSSPDRRARATEDGHDRSRGYGSGYGRDESVDPDRNIDPGYDGDTVRCHHCGVRNVDDRSYTYCWNCVSPLRH